MFNKLDSCYVISSELKGLSKPRCRTYWRCT